MTAAYRLVDLCQLIYDDMPHGHVVPGPTLTVLQTAGSADFSMMEFKGGTHLGTHVDAPIHFVPGGKTIDQIALEQFSGEAVIVPIHRPGKEAFGIADVEASGLSIGQGDMVFFKTGWGVKWGESDYHLHPYIDAELAQWLVARGVKVVGVDFVTPDMPFPLREKEFSYPIHRTLLEAETLIIENLKLTELEPGRVLAQAFPMPLRGADAAPARVCALLPE